MNLHTQAIDWKKILYPTISSIVILVMLICFFSTTSFLSKNLNKIFNADQSTQDETTNIDLTQLELVAKKLNIKFIPATNYSAPAK